MKIDSKDQYNHAERCFTHPCTRLGSTTNNELELHFQHVQDAVVPPQPMHPDSIFLCASPRLAYMYLATRARG